IVWGKQRPGDALSKARVQRNRPGSALQPGVLSFFAPGISPKGKGGRVWQKVRPKRRGNRQQGARKPRRQGCRSGGTFRLMKRKRRLWLKRPSWSAAIATTPARLRRCKWTCGKCLGREDCWNGR